MSYDDFLFKTNQRYALIKARSIRKSPCRICGFYGCICQEKLSPLLKKRRATILKDKCPKCKLYLCDCERNYTGELL